MKQLWMLVLLLLCTPACGPSRTGPVLLGRGVAFSLREPAQGPDFFANQQVVFNLPDGTESTLLTTLENGKGRLSIVASTPMGQTLFTVCQTGKEATVEAHLPLPSQFDPRLLPALVQLANWPLEEVRAGLGKGLELKEEGAARTLWRKGKLVLKLRREGNSAPFKRVEMDIPNPKIHAQVTTLEENP